MTTSEVTLIPLRHLRVLPNNPRTVTQAKLNQLCDSIRENGFYAHRALAVEPIPGTKGSCKQGSLSDPFPASPRGWEKAYPRHLPKGKGEERLLIERIKRII